MSVLTATRHYEIDDTWLNNHQADSSAYVDLEEVLQMRSQYVTDMGLNPSDESVKANFICIGTMVGDTDGGPEIEGVLAGEPITQKDVMKYAQGIMHPLAYKRIYARRTLARHIWFCGYSK